MHQEELREGTSVFTSDGDELGEINRFVIDPKTNEVTHIVVQKGWLFAEDKVVPFDMVHSRTDEGLVLSDEIQDLDQLPPFEETHYIEASARNVNAEPVDEDPGYPSGPTYYWYPPHGYLGYPDYGLGLAGVPLAVTEQNIPEDTVPLQEGTNVVSADDEHVGDVDRLLIEEGSNKVTHFVISQGLFFKDRKLVPVSWIQSVVEDKVRLNVSSEVLKSLPAYERD